MVIPNVGHRFTLGRPRENKAAVMPEILIFLIFNLLYIAVFFVGFGVGGLASPSRYVAGAILLAGIILGVACFFVPNSLFAGW